MEDEPRFSEKWDFRRKENDFEDSSSDDPESNSTHDPTIHNPNLPLEPNQIDKVTTTVTREQQPVKTRKRRINKDESKPVKTKQVRKRKPKKTVQVEEETKKKQEVEEEIKKKQEETVAGMDGVGMFMDTLLDDLTASRERLMEWMKTELCGSSEAQTPVKMREVRPVKKRMTKKKKEEEKESEKQSKPRDTSGLEMNKPEEKSSEIVHNGHVLDCNIRPLDTFLDTPKAKSPEIAQNGADLDCNTRPLVRFLKKGQGGLGRTNETVESQKSIVLAIEAPNQSKKQKKTTEANTNKNRTSSMVEKTGPEPQRDHDFVTPFASKPSSSPSLQSYPVPSSLFPKLPSSSLLQSYPVPTLSQGYTPFASNNTNYHQLRQPVAQIPDLSEFQTGDTTGGQGFGNLLFQNNNYFSGFPTAFQSNLMGGGYNFAAQVNPETFSQQRDSNNMFGGGPRMVGGAIRFSGNRVPESGTWNQQ